MLSQALTPANKFIHQVSVTFTQKTLGSQMDLNFGNTRFQ